MANAVNHLEGLNEGVSYYTASYSPYLQGSEITQVWQLTNFLNVKIRANTDFVFARSGSSADHMSNSDQISAYNDTNAPENFGTLITKKVEKYTLGRTSSLGPTGESSYITFLLSGSNGFGPSGSIRSQASLQVPGRLDYYVSHIAEQRSLGQSPTWTTPSIFEEYDPININPAGILLTHPQAVVAPINLVQVCGSPASYDGVIEPFTIRSVIDRSSIELPYVSKGIKSTLSISDMKEKSYLLDDKYDLRQQGNQLGSAPYLDAVEIFGTANCLIDQPGAFSDSFENLSPFADSTKAESNFRVGFADAGMLNLFVSGVTSGTSQYFSADTDQIPSYIVVSRHGFVFSQKDNYGYDSIAFGGLKK